ncbi:YTH domain-containing protein ECT4-like [Bidens hawaiensis]|uniref:YTH domain-containing protein ECT4-like n=1 Tax=Bidens hawaiensis TaxID=980011 RepID=UPI00404AFDF9
MAAVVPTVDDTASLLKNLALESKTKSLEITDTVKKLSVDTGNGKVQPSNGNVAPFNPALAYYPYYYGGYDGTTNSWDEVDLAHGLYGYDYAPYGAYDGQLYGSQPYQYPSTYFQPPTSTGGSYPAKVDTTTPATTDANKAGVGNGIGLKGTTGSTPAKPTPYQNSAFKANGLYGTGAQNSMYASTGYMNGMYSNKLYGQYGYGTTGYGTTGYGYQNNGRGWLTVDNKFKPRMRANGFFGYNHDNSDGLNELNRGPRAKPVKTQKSLTPIADGGEDELKDVKEVHVGPVREDYNDVEFPETYADAKFFIIKSYSEDDVHKSIKYNVWASTQNGNKKLDAAYREAQAKPDRCPIFLFFSVNTSGQFVGVAEMVGLVDFNKSLEYWQQDKWIGCFPVKWHIVKDLPNGMLKHIILEYNENKPVTNSRDTQEVKLVQGLQMIKIFKEHSSKQCILDDFEFYEDRQKKIQHKKAKQQQFQKQSWEGKVVTDKVKEDIEEGEIVESDDEASKLVKEVKLVDNVKDVVKAEEEKVVVNGEVANAC